MRLIDADSLPYDEFLNYRMVLWKDIEKAKTIDAIPVVRCQYCKHCQYDTLFDTRWCNGKEVTAELIGIVPMVKGKNNETD